MNIKIPQLKYNNPMGNDKINEIIELLDLNESQKVIDFGGGNGQILIEILNKTNASGVLIEIDKKLVEFCENNSEELIKKERLIIENKDVNLYLKEIPLLSIDCAVCIGSSGIFGGYLETIKKIKPYLKDDGVLFIGELYWKNKPDIEYLQLTGLEESHFMYHYQNIEEVEKLDMKYLYSNIASEDDWNSFEGNHYLINSFSLNEDIREKKKIWRKAQIKYGLKTMGFALYLFSKNDSSLNKY